MTTKPLHHRYRFHDRYHHIDFHITKVGQLFDTRDPAPFRERDLDDNFVRSLVNSARELHKYGPFKLCLKIATESRERISPKEVTQAIHNYFIYEAEFEEAELRTQRARGFAALLLGLIFLAFCTAGAYFVPHFFDGMLAKILGEGLTILGWVALWEPASILLYNWLPIAQKIKIYKILSQVPVDIIFQD